MNPTDSSHADSSSRTFADSSLFSDCVLCFFSPSTCVYVCACLLTGCCCYSSWIFLPVILIKFI